MCSLQELKKCGVLFVCFNFVDLSPSELKTLECNFTPSNLHGIERDFRWFCNHQIISVLTSLDSKIGSYNNTCSLRIALLPQTGRPILNIFLAISTGASIILCPYVLMHKIEIVVRWMEKKKKKCLFMFIAYF